MISHEQQAAPAVNVSRCRDAAMIARVLERDYFDEPIRSFPPGLKRAFARLWCARRDEVYFMTAEVEGVYGGFVLAHTLGDGLVKLFARRHPLYLIPLLRVWLRARAASKRSAPSPAVDVEPRGRAEAGDIPDLPRPFTWSPADGRTARIALVFVSPEQRGLGLAQALLGGGARELAAGGVRSVEAHIDSTNLSSVRAFRKAGWDLYRMSGGDFFAGLRVS